jgi:chemotaxis protein MotB
MQRKPAYLQAGTAGRERWLVSYTDILTLLLILFIAMAAQSLGHQQAPAVEAKVPAQTTLPPPAPTNMAPSSASPPAPVQVTPPSNAAEPVPAPAPVPPPQPNPSREALLRAEARLKQRGLDLHLEARGLIISLPQAILFASGDDRINASALPIISEIADVLRGLDNKVELAGHADSVPIHTKRFKNNWELSAARGLSLLNTLTSSYGISESRLTVSSYGSYSPKTSNDTPDGRAENRRVEILILDQAPQ